MGTLQEFQYTQRVERHEPTDRTGRVNGLGDGAVRTQQEPGGMQETSLGFDERTGEFMDLLDIRAVQHRVGLDTQPVDQSLGRDTIVDRKRHDLGILLVEQGNDVVEVNQLLTAVRSPVPSVEQHDAPRTVEQIRNGDLGVVETHCDQLRELIAYVELHQTLLTIGWQ